MDTTTQSADLTKLFGLDELNEDEREAFLADIGTTLLESALLSFTLSLDEAGQAAFEQFLATAGEGEEMITALSDKYPQFVEVLQDEMVQFREEAQKVFGN